MSSHIGSINKNGWIEGLRAILLSYIAFHHFTSRYMDFYPEVVFNYSSEIGGRVGNFMFMMISGYFLAKSLLQGYGLKDLSKYCVNRWWRLFPAIVLCTSVTYLMVTISPLNGRVVNFSQFLLNFLIIHPNIPYVDGSHWFASSLLQMQLLLGLFLLIKNNKTRIYSIVGLYIFSLILYFVFDVPTTRLDNVLFYLTNSSWLPVLLSGCILYYARSNYLSKVFYIVPCLMVLIHVFTYKDWILIFPFSLFMIFIFDIIRVDCPQFLSKWGGVSFYWYLLHQNIGFCIMNELRGVGVTDEFCLVTSALVFTLVLAFGVDSILKFVPKKIYK